MQKTYIIRPLGRVLVTAGLVSVPQLEVALKDQVHNYEMQLGEILALRGWLKAETADFFAEEWPTLVKENNKQKLGHYLKQAGLLDDNEIKAILAEQKQMGVRFGSLAVLRGALKQSTLDFFLEHLTPEQTSKSAFVGKSESESPSNIILPHKGHIKNDIETLKAEKAQLMEAKRIKYFSEELLDSEDFDLAWLA